MNLEERLYTSTEVAEILGVSLRSVYRYLDEGKLQAEVKTATGRHRFTKQNILDFLYPSEQSQKETVKENREETKTTAQPVKETFAKREPIQPEKVEPIKQKVEQTPASGEPETEEPIDWLEKFRAAANKYKEEEIKKDEPVVDTTTAINQMSYDIEAAPKKQEEDQFYYYRSLTGGLKDIAQNIDKSARKASIDYAFTMNSGLSLHKPIKPFSLLHVYVRPEDREFFERMLHLVPAEESNAQLCLISSENKNLFNSRKEMHGLYVVSDAQLKKDLMDYGEEQLSRDFESML